MAKSDKARTRRGSGGAANGNEQEQRVVVPNGATKPKKLTDLMRLCRTSSENIGEINGTVRETIGDAVENHGLHKKAFSMVRQLDKLSPEKLNDLLAHFNYYLDISGLNKRAATAPRLEDATPPGEGDGEADAATAGNVAQFPAPQGSA